MNFLLDTHIALWFIADSKKLSEEGYRIIEEDGHAFYISVISTWEILLKHQAHPDKLPVTSDAFEHDCAGTGFKIIPLRSIHVREAARLPTDDVHKDPFDRILLAQARAENLTFMTHDRAFASYDDPHVLIV